ncbi:MAG: hypothetical protein V4654_09080 [Bdellovibrionota bacterium]
MSIDLVLGGLFFFVVIAFLGGMFLLPERFDISKNKEPDFVSFFCDPV